MLDSENREILHSGFQVYHMRLFHDPLTYIPLVFAYTICHKFHFEVRYSPGPGHANLRTVGAKAVKS